MKEQILELRAQGKTYDEIVAILGCSKSTVSYHCGEGQKEKAKERFKRNSKNSNRRVTKKLDRFLRENVKSFRRDRNTNLLRSGVSYKEAFEKIIGNPFCYLTGREIDFEDNNSYQLDHIMPSSRGGSNELDNLGLACKDANQSKTNLTVEEYLALCKEVLEFNGYEVIKKG